MEKDILAIYCPACGAPAQFDIVHQVYRCQYCGEQVSIEKAREAKSQIFRRSSKCPREEYRLDHRRTRHHVITMYVCRKMSENRTGIDILQYLRQPVTCLTIRIRLAVDFVQPMELLHASSIAHRLLLRHADLLRRAIYQTLIAQSPFAMCEINDMDVKLIARLQAQSNCGN